MTLGELIGPDRARKLSTVTLAQVLSHRGGLAANPELAGMIAARNLGESLPSQRRPSSTKRWQPNHCQLLARHFSIPISTTSWRDRSRAEDRAHVGGPLARGSPCTIASLERGIRDSWYRGCFDPATWTSCGRRCADACGTRAFADNPALLGPAGTLHFSIGDLARWGQENLRGARGIDGLLRSATFKSIQPRSRS